MKIDRLLLRLAKENNLTKDEYEHVEKWRRDHKKYADKIKLYDGSDPIKLSEMEMNIAFNTFKKEVHSKRKILFQRWTTVAAIMLIGFVVYILLSDKSSLSSNDMITNIEGVDFVKLTRSTGELINLETQSKPIKPNIIQDSIIHNTISVPAGKTWHLTLSDGTEIDLNASSELTYTTPLVIKGQRRVILKKGEGYFSVAKNKALPFIVNANQLDIRVLGTEFNINQYGTQQIALLTGSVSIYNQKEYVQLKPNEMYVQDTIPYICQIDQKEVVAWRDNLFLFNQRPFEEIVKVLASWYDVTFEFTNSKLKQKKLYCKLPRSLKLDDLLKILSENGQFHFVQEGNKVQIY